jgi:VRR-NUC domain
MKPSTPLEHQIQKAFFQWWELQYGNPLCWATPNGGYRNIVTATKLKAEGVRAGVPDVFLAIPNDNYHGLFMEFKRAKGKLQPNQELYLALLDQVGYKTVVVRSVKEAIDAVQDYLGPLNPRRVSVTP